MKRLFSIDLWKKDSALYLTPEEVVHYSNLYSILDGQELDQNNHFINPQYHNENYLVLNNWVKVVNE